MLMGLLEVKISYYEMLQTTVNLADSTDVILFPFHFEYSDI